MGLIITKLANDNVEVTSTVATHIDYTLNPELSIYRNKSTRIDGADVIGVDEIRDVFLADKVDKVVRKDGTEVAISDGDTLYAELKDYFFYLSNEATYYLSFEGINDYAEFSSIISLVGDFSVGFEAVTQNYTKFIGGSNSSVESRGANQLSLNIPSRKVMAVPNVVGDYIELGRDGADLYAKVNGVEVDRLVGQATAQTCNFQYMARNGDVYAPIDFYKLKFTGIGVEHDFDIAHTDGITINSLTSILTATIYGATRHEIT